MFILASVLDAQTPLATLVGTLRDSSGGVMAEAAVTVRHVTSGAVRKMQTTQTGDFTFISLPIGEYEIEAEHPGFQRQKIRILTVYYGEDPSGVTCIHGSFYEIESA